jgi:hypothetical protein
MRRIYSLLLVHSEPSVADPLASALRARRCFVARGTGVHSALRLVSTLRFDAVVAAAELRDGRGAELLGALRASLPALGLLLLGASQPWSSADFVGVDEPYDAGHILRLAELSAAEAGLTATERMVRGPSFRQ